MCAPLQKYSDYRQRIWKWKTSGGQIGPTKENLGRFNSRY